MGNLGAEKAKNQGLGWQQGCGGGALVKAPEEKWGKMGKAPEEKWGKWGKMGKNGGKWGKLPRKNGGKWGKMGKNGGKWGNMGENGGKWGGNGEEMGGKGTGCTTQVSLFPPIFPHFPPFPPHFPPFSPIFPHLSPFFLARGTLWVRLWVQYPPPEPGTSEPCLCRDIRWPLPGGVSRIPPSKFTHTSGPETTVTLITGRVRQMGLPCICEWHLRLSSTEPATPYTPQHFWECPRNLPH